MSKGHVKHLVHSIQHLTQIYNDMVNSFRQMPVRSLEKQEAEKKRTLAGPEFGEPAGWKAPLLWLALNRGASTSEFKLRAIWSCACEEKPSAKKKKAREPELESWVPRALGV